jgi:hypothetical protein
MSATTELKETAPSGEEERGATYGNLDKGLQQAGKSVEKRDRRTPAPSSATQLTELFKEFENELVEVAKISRGLYEENRSEADRQKVRQAFDEKWKALGDRHFFSRVDSILKTPDYLVEKSSYRFLIDEKTERLLMIIRDGRPTADGQELSMDQQPVIAWIRYDLLKDQLDWMKTYRVPRFQ